MKPLSSRDIDPRVFVENFAMQDTPPELEPLDVPSPDPSEDDFPMEELESPEMPPDDGYDPTPANSYGPTQPYVEQPIEIKRRQEPVAGGGNGGSFCTLYEDPADSGDWFVTGGAVRINNTKTFEVAPYEVGPSDGEWLLYIQTNVEVNRTTEGDYFESGIKTTTDTSLTIQDTTSLDAYPDGTDPTLADGLAVVTLAVGRLRKQDGIPTLYPTGCGSFLLTHCDGEISHLPR